MPDLIGSTLGPYRILEQIGLGGMATVFKAYQPGMDRLVALKILPEHFAAQPRFAQRFEREARIIAKLEHRNILPVYDFGQAGGLTYLVMRYLQAGTVKDILSHGPLPLGDAARVLADVASALDYAHAQGIVHRDVKPSNILVDTQGSAYLTDFGIAKVLEGTQELTGTSTLGTPAYMAPEQTLGKPVTPQSDVYSLGVMLYEMVTGKAPFESDTPMAVALMHVHEPLPLPRRVNPQIPEAVELVILKALAKEPKDRYASAGDLARAFSGAVGAEAMAVPSRLLELAGVAATGKGSEEVTYDIREEIKKRERTERTRRVMRWAPFTVGGVIAVVLIGVALVYATTQTTSAQATVTYVANLPTATRYPTNTPLPTATATATAVPTPTAIPLSWARLNSGQFLTRDNVTAIVIDPNDPDVMYVGTDNAGIYKSIDGGLSWQPSHNGLGRAWVNSLVIDPRDPDTLYAGVLLGGVYKTTDGGKNWRAANNGIGDIRGWEWFSIVVMDPQDSQHLYYTQSADLYESKDAGESWAKVLAGGCPFSTVSLAFDPANASHLFAVRWDNEGKCPVGVYASVDGGQSWELTGFPAPAQWTWAMINWRLVIDSQQGNHLYVYGAGTYHSGDRGHTWEEVRMNCDTLAVLPDEAATAYCTDGSIVRVTTDAGKNWQQVAQLDLEHARSIALGPPASQLMLLGAGGVWASTDAGESWASRSSGLGALRLELYLDPTQPGALFVEDSSCRTFESLDAGRTWETSFAPHCHFQFARSLDGSVLYWADSDWLYRSKDGGKTADKFQMPETGVYPEAMALHPVIPDRLYALYSREEGSPYLFVSDDGGATWRPTSGMQSIADGKLFFDHDQGQRMYAIGDLDNFRSDDAGETWTTCTYTNSWHARAASRLVVDPRDPNYLLLATRGDGVLISRDGCQNWKQSNTGLGSPFVNTIAYDPQSPNTVYAGTDGGAYVSFDGGQHWGPINDGLLGALVVYSIVIDPQSNVYAATPYGIFKLQTP